MPISTVVTPRRLSLGVEKFLRSSAPLGLGCVNYDLASIRLLRNVPICWAGNFADIRHGLDLWRRTSGSFHMSYYLSDFADLLLRGREYDEADRALREAEQIVADTAVFVPSAIVMLLIRHTPKQKAKELC